MEATGSSQISEQTYYATRCKHPEDRHLNNDRLENLKNTYKSLLVMRYLTMLRRQQRLCIEAAGQNESILDSVTMCEKYLVTFSVVSEI